VVWNGFETTGATPAPVATREFLMLGHGSYCNQKDLPCVPARALSWSHAVQLGACLSIPGSD